MTNGYTHTKTGTDCGIVAISNYIGKTYEEVRDAAMESGFMIDASGLTKNNKINDCLTLLGWRATVIPDKSIVDRRRFSGFYSYCHSIKAVGHIVPCIDGHMFDFDGSVSALCTRGRHPKREIFYAVYPKGDTL